MPPQANQLVLETGRLILRFPAAEDALAISRLANNINIARMVAHVRHPYREEDARQWLEIIAHNHQNLLHVSLVICLKSSKKIVGTCGATHIKQQTYGLGYWIGEGFWGNGYATEATQELIEFLARKREAKHISAWYADDNPASRRVLEKCRLAFKGKTGPVHSIGRGCDVPCSLMEMDVDRS